MQRAFWQRPAMHKSITNVTKNNIETKHLHPHLHAEKTSAFSSSGKTIRWQSNGAWNSKLYNNWPIYCWFSLLSNAIILILKKSDPIGKKHNFIVHALCCLRTHVHETFCFKPTLNTTMTKRYIQSVQGGTMPTNERANKQTNKHVIRLLMDNFVFHSNMQITTTYTLLLPLYVLVAPLEFTWSTSAEFLHGSGRANIYMQFSLSEKTHMSTQISLC